MDASVADLRPTERFSNRVEYYVRARPDYPKALLEFLKSDLGLTASHRIADIGSGTGLLSELFLRNGNSVLGVEPNAEMRAAGDNHLKSYPNFRSCNATAEATALPDRCADFIVAGQAFHWFDPVKTRTEFQRILAPDGWVTLVWNERKRDAGEFEQAYDELVRNFAADKRIEHRRTVSSVDSAVLGPFFGAGGFQIREFDHFQDLDLDDVKARLLSSSYMPLENDPAFPAMMASAEAAFNAHAADGRVRISYDTRAYYGRMR